MVFSFLFFSFYFVILLISLSKIIINEVSFKSAAELSRNQENGFGNDESHFHVNSFTVAIVFIPSKSNHLFYTYCSYRPNGRFLSGVFVFLFFSIFHLLNRILASVRTHRIQIYTDMHSINPKAKHYIHKLRLNFEMVRYKERAPKISLKS